MSYEAKCLVGAGSLPPLLRPNPQISCFSINPLTACSQAASVRAQAPPRMRKVGQHDSAAYSARSSLHSSVHATGCQSHQALPNFLILQRL